MRGRAGLLGLGVVLLLLPVQVQAEEIKNKGLFITPLRAYPSVSPGQVAHGTFTLANITPEPATVDISVEQFSVADYTYDYQFYNAKEDWIRLSKTQVTLDPNKSHTITYTISPPSDAMPGGHYFTLFATAQLPHSPHKVRTATVLYLTVDGELHKTSTITRSSIAPLSFGGNIDFTMDVTNTGNTHFFAYVSGELQGLSASSKNPDTTTLLLPEASRVISGGIAAPLLPGVYKAVYGYKTDDGQQIRREAFICYLPPWSLLIPGGLAWLAYIIRHYRKRKATAP